MKPFSWFAARGSPRLPRREGSGEVSDLRAALKRAAILIANNPHATLQYREGWLDALSAVAAVGSGMYGKPITHSHGANEAYGNS